MDWFPKISDYSPQKVGNVVKQDKTKQQRQKRADEEEPRDEEKQESKEDKKPKPNGLLDVYV